MTVDESALAALKYAYKQWDATKGDSGNVWLALCADNISFTSLSDGSPGLEFSRAGSSKEDLVRYLTGLAKDWTMNFYRVDSYLVDGDQVVCRGECSFQNRHTGKKITTPKADFWRFKDGKIVEFSEFYDTAQMNEACKSD